MSEGRHQSSCSPGGLVKHSSWIVSNQWVLYKQEMSYSVATAPADLHDSCISDWLKRVVAWCVRIVARITAGIVLNSRTQKDIVGYLTLGNGKGSLTLWEGESRLRDRASGRVSLWFV